jgi:beta-lactamase class A
VERQIEWWLTHLNKDAFASVGENELRQHFHPSFLQAIPADQFRVTSRRLATVGPYSLERFEKEPSSSEGVAILTTPSGTRFRLFVNVESSKPHGVTGLSIRAAAADRAGPVATTWGEFDQRLRPLASSVGFLAAEIKGDRLEPIHGFQPDTALALGSTFKLYVLGEIAHQISDGKASWDEELAIKEEVRSLSVGTLRNADPGVKFSIRYYAEKMISISDNTATDHLLFRAGRSNVETFQRAMGHQHPELNMPFLSTREFFLMKLGPDIEAQEYADAGEAKRRQILQGLSTRMLQRVFTIWRAPRYINDLEWFASPNEISQAMLTLKMMSEDPKLAAVRSILSINPGLPFDKSKWSYVGFKGGGEPGVSNMTWLLGRADGRWFTLSVGLNDSLRVINTFQVSNLMLSALALISK